MPNETNTTKEALDYLSSMLQQLKSIAESHDLKTLAYLIDMAQMEAAESLAEAPRLSKIGRQQRDSAA